MEIRIIPRGDSHNSYDAADNDSATELYIELPDGRKLTLAAPKLARAMHALGIGGF